MHGGHGVGGGRGAGVEGIKRRLVVKKEGV